MLAFAVGSTIDGQAVRGSTLQQLNQEEWWRAIGEGKHKSKRSEKGFKSTSKACLPPVVDLRKFTLQWAEIAEMQSEVKVFYSWKTVNLFQE